MKAFAATLLRHRRIMAVSVAVVVAAAAGLAVFLLTQNSGRDTVAIRNVSQNYRVCVFTVTGKHPTWAAVEAAKEKVPINVERMTVPHDTTKGLVPRFNSLIAMKCDLIVADASELADAVATAARKHPEISFLVPNARGKSDNVAALPASPGSITAKVVASARAYYRTTTTVPAPTRGA